MKNMGGMIVALAAAGISLSGCATTAITPPAEAIRYHLGQPIARGTVAVEPLQTTAGIPPSLEYRSYAAAVEAELLRNGYSRATPGATPEYVATVAFRRRNDVGPPRRSPFSIGIGGGGFSGGRRGGGVGLGGGIGFPLGGGRARELVVSELAVTIKRRADLSPIWEGNAQAAADVRSSDGQTDALAARLARALFTAFPGESGRTIEVR
ncbi:DUF4136 domain-containing protein [uncultured Sphingomonas sp.]|uniref:DUF4136 domain-containing protein n=1 Tax=uncultured Sphingomonas sp. TaxID=158754 RepID=UPI0035CC20F0